MKIAVIHQGRFGNKVFQYLVARQLSSILRAGEVAGCHIPELGIRSPAPAGLGRTLMCTGNRLAVDDVLLAVSRSRFDSVVVSGNVLQYRCLPSPDTARRWLGLEAALEGGTTVPGDHVVVHVRSGDIVFGAHRDYPPIPPTFYERVIADAGLPPIFVTEPGDNYYVQHLKRRWPRASFVSNADPMADFLFLMSARHLAVASSTFGWLAGWLGRAETVHLPLIGITNPAQRPDVDLVPADDRRYRYWLFPEFRFHARPSEISILLSGSLAPKRINDLSQLRRRAWLGGRSELRRVADGDRWIRRRESLVREPTLEPGAVGRLWQALSARLAGRYEMPAIWVVQTVGFLMWARSSLPEHLAAAAIVGVGFLCASTAAQLGFPHLTMTRSSLNQFQASAMHWSMVITSVTLGLLGIGLGLTAEVWNGSEGIVGLTILASAALAIHGLCVESSAVISRVDGGAMCSTGRILGTAAAWAGAAWFASRQLMSASIACIAVGPVVGSGAICAILGGWVPCPPERGAGLKPLLQEGGPDWAAEIARVVVLAGIAASVWLAHGTQGMAVYAPALCALAATSTPRIRRHSPTEGMMALPSALALALGAAAVVTAPTVVEALPSTTWAGVGAGLQVIAPWYAVAYALSWDRRRMQAAERHGDSSARNTLSGIALIVAAGIAIACASLIGITAMLHVTGAVMVALVIWQEGGYSIPFAWLRMKRAASSLAWPAASAIAGGLAGTWAIHALDGTPSLLRATAAAATTLLVSLVTALLLGGPRRSIG